MGAWGPAMSTFRLTIKLGNDAMQSSTDVAEALTRAAGWIEDYAAMTPGESLSLLDQNGNHVGEWKVTP